MTNKFSKEDGYLESDFLHFGYDHIDTALSLMNDDNSDSYDSAGYLLHLGFELLLKGKRSRG